jgi:hypothetical protein
VFNAAIAHQSLFVTMHLHLSKTKSLALVLAALSVFTLSGCAHVGTSSSPANTGLGETAAAAQSAQRVEAVNFQLNGAAWQPAPECVWVKPFKSVEQYSRSAQLARKSVWAHVATRGYNMQPLDEAAAEPSCDYAIQGELTDAKRDFMVFFSQNAIAANVQLVRLSTGQQLWAASDTVDVSDGGLPLSLIGLSSGVWAASENMKPDRYLMAVDALARRLVASLPYRVAKAPTQRAGAIEWPEDLDAWLAQQPLPDREQALLELMSQPMTAKQSEAAYARLTSVAPAPVHWRSWVLSRMQRAENERALALFDTAGDVLVDDPQSNYLKARLLTSLRRYEEALTPLMQAIQLNPHEPTYFETMAHIEIQRHEPQRAIAAFTKVVALDPSQGYAWLNIGLLAQAEGDWDLSLEALGQAGERYVSDGDAAAVDVVIHALQDMADQGSTQATVQIEALQQRKPAPGAAT